MQPKRRCLNYIIVCQDIGMISTKSFRLDQAVNFGDRASARLAIYGAPASIHLRSRSTCAAGRMCLSAALVVFRAPESRSSSLLAPASPGTTQGPWSPLEMTASKLSTRNPPLSFCSPWQETHDFAKTGLTSRSNSGPAQSGAAEAAVAAADAKTCPNVILTIMHTGRRARELSLCCGGLEMAKAGHPW